MFTYWYPDSVVAPPRVVLHHLADDGALGVEHRQPAADLGREREQVQLGPELAVVAPLGLGEHGQVLVLRVTRLPGGAVDPLELRVLLAAAPVRPAAAHQLERRDVPGGGNVRAAAQVLPDDLTRVRAEVVVDGQLGAAHLDRLLGLLAALEADQLQLVRFGGQLRAGIIVGDDAPGEPLSLPDDLPHALLDRLQVLRVERAIGVEVVVEAILDRRPDAQLGLREQVLDGLRHDVGGRMPQDRAPVGVVDPDRFDHVPVGDLAVQVTQFPVDPRRDHGVRPGGLLPQPGPRQYRAGRHARADHMLASGESATKRLR